MKRKGFLAFLFRTRSYVKLSYKMISKLADEMVGLKELITNHILHRLDEHESLIKEIHDVIVGPEDDSST